MKWRAHSKRWVNGSIDSQGAIHASASVDIEMHSGALLNGKRWRWNIHSQEFCAIAPRTIEELNNRIRLLTLNEEELFTVCDWLVRNGFAGEEILPEPTQ